MKGFMEFIRKQGVIGLAVGFVLGASVTQVVNSFVDDIINPILGLFLGVAGDLSEAVLVVGPVEIRYGNFLTVFIDFLVVAFVIYFFLKITGLDKIDIKVKKPKAKKK